MLINVHEAKTHLSRLLERVAHGEEIVIGKAGKPVAKLVPYHEARGPRSPGAWKGRVRIAPGFDELPAEVAAAFLGENG
ncbi:MAG: type II toxin-antitoxin system Phd/YefM family antitoxin [Actinomycetota bacterium]